MERQAGWTMVTDIGAAIASGNGARAAVDVAVERLASLCGIAVELWTMTEQSGQLHRLAGSVNTPVTLGLPAVEPVLARALATLKTVTNVEQDGTPAFVAVPLVAHGRGQGVLLAQTTRPEASVLACQTTLEELAPLLGLLLHAVSLDATLRANANADGLAHLYTRRHLRDNLERELARARRTHAAFAILLVSLDRAEALDLEHGPAASDQALRGLAALLRATCRTHDAVGRFSSDRFLVLLPGSDGKGAQLVAHRLLQQLYRAPLTLPHDQAQQLRVSIGVACFPVDGFSADELLESASTALSEAQRLGGNRVAAA